MLPQAAPSWCLVAVLPVLVHALSAFSPSIVNKNVATKFSSQVRLPTRSRVLMASLHSVDGDVAEKPKDVSISAMPNVGSRRAFFVSTASAAVAGLSLTSTPSVHNMAIAAESTTTPDYNAVAADIADLIKANPDWGPTLIRLAWHSSGTYDKMTKTGGSFKGTMRFKEENSHPANAGLAATAIKWMEPIHDKYAKDGLSYADLYTLAGVVAVKSLGGPSVPWSYGRVDSMDPADVTPDGRLPAADTPPPGADKSDAAHLRTIFGRMGFNDRDIVALSGAHALGRCHTTASGYDGPWTFTPTVFSNQYFTLLKSLPWTVKQWDGPLQYEDPSGKLMMLPTDLVLLQDKKFKKYVDEYASSEAKFDKDFVSAFQKLLELGTTNLTPVNLASA